MIRKNINKSFTIIVSLAVLISVLSLVSISQQSLTAAVTMNVTPDNPVLYGDSQEQQRTSQEPIYQQEYVRKDNPFIS